MASFAKSIVSTPDFLYTKGMKHHLFHSREHIGITVSVLTALAMICGCAPRAVKEPPGLLRSHPYVSVDRSGHPRGRVVQSPVSPDGIIFGKTDFRGVVQTDYVKLTIVDRKDPDKEYYLYIGARRDQKILPLDAKPVEPSYYYLQLPAGDYKISNISIPVGTTLATEPMDVRFSVKRQTVVYLGTLRVTGTEEKLRLGGIPMIQPGFDYHVEVLDEQPEALGAFKRLYPTIHWTAETGLMQARPLSELKS